MRKEPAVRLFDRYTGNFDVEDGFVGEGERGHRRHRTHESALYAKVIFLLQQEEYYGRARKILKNICECQDKIPVSRTFGLWPVIVEDKLEDQEVVDYNWAEFIGSTLICILKEKEELLGAELAAEVRESLRLAARCAIRRHVGLDYTNVICMSCFLITATGEILGDTELLEAGQKELRRFVEYTRVCGGFNEYNSPCYIRVAAEAIANMIAYFENEEYRKMAFELNDYLWEMGARQYSSIFQEYTPPYVRNYSDLDPNSRDAFFIGYATNGAYGKLPEESLVIEGRSKLDGTEISCPPKFYPLFEENGWYQIPYYKKNQLREKEEDVTIVQDFDSPDLLAYSYKTEQYLFGALQKTDLWGQRRTLMTIWNPEEKRCLKLCAEKDGADFSSAMAYTLQEKGKALVLLGFANDHGDKHYIEDPLINGRIRAKKLAFLLKLGGAAKGLQFEKHGEQYLLRDGDFEIRVNVLEWMFDGQSADVRISEEGLELICFEENQEREVNFCTLSNTYGAFSIAINGKPMEGEVKLCGGRVAVYSPKEGCSIEGYCVPRAYNDCISRTFLHGVL